MGQDTSATKRQVTTMNDAMVWSYDRMEILADGIIHALGASLGLCAVVVLIVLASQTASAWELVAALVYGASLLGVLVISAAYNLWPVSPAKWALRRYDHSAIYCLIAGTYTPFIAQMSAGPRPLLYLTGIWGTALLGVTLKLRFPGRFDRLAIANYLLISWSGVAAYETLFALLPRSTVLLLALGGILYTTGVTFHLWQGLRFHNAIWHGFVLLAAICHYGAVLDCLVLART